MSLKAFHLVFIVASILLAAGFAVWSFMNYAAPTGTVRDLLVGIGASYFIRNGLQAGLDFEGWFLGDPTIYKLSPRVDYVAWRMQRIKPYAGAFYRWNFIGGGIDDKSSLGGRVGAFYKGDRGGMAGAGVVYERYLNLDNRFGSSDVFYPEFFFAVSF